MAARKAFLDKVTPVSDAMLRAPAAADWLMWRGTYETLGYSPLEQINKRNVRTLGVAWTLALPPSANEAAPLVHDGLLFIESADTIEAVNAVDGGILWQYIRPLPDALHNGRDARMKGLAIYQDKLYAPTADGHIVALDAKTGDLRWDHAVVTPAQGVQPGLFDGAYFHISGGTAGGPRQGDRRREPRHQHRRRRLHRRAGCTDRQGGLALRYHRPPGPTRRQQLEWRAGG